MKTISSTLLPIVLVLALSGEAMAGTISGNISYTGTQTGKIVVVAFADSTFRGSPTATAELNSPGSYLITGVSDGTYYFISIMFTDSTGVIKLTDPWMVYWAEGKITPVTITGGGNFSGVDMTLVDGTVNEPNPFYRKPAVPQLTKTLPEITRAGKNPSITSDGSSMYLYKHDFQNAASAKIFKINPASGEVTTTYILALQSSANGISWIDKLTFHKGAFWAVGGYGDPSGTDRGMVGVFKIDIATSKSSNQLPAGPGIDTTNELGGLASDGVNLYVGVNLLSAQQDRGIVKFDPSLVSAIPSAPLLKLAYRPSYMCYADNCIWVGVDSVLKMNPVNGTTLSSYYMPSEAAQLYFNEMFWMYDQSDNTLKAYSPSVTRVSKGVDLSTPTCFALSQNYPNPFNPSTSISFSLPTQSFVSLKVFDLIGKEVTTLVSDELPAGNYTSQWNAADMPSGVYFYRLQTGSFVKTLRLLLLK